MARIYVGNESMVDDGVLAAARELPDDFWIFTEFDLGGRNLDWLVFREASTTGPLHRFSTMISAEVKRTSAVLSGGPYDDWTEDRGDGQQTILYTGSKTDSNYFKKAVSTSNIVKSWLFNNQYRFMSSPNGEQVTEDNFRVWPLLLILSPDNVNHRLPLRIQGERGYGEMYFGPNVLGRWQQRLLTWSQRYGVPLGPKELEALAGLLHLRPLPAPASTITTVEPREMSGASALNPFEPGGASTSDGNVGDEDWDVDAPPAPANLDWIDALADWALSVENRLAQLEARAVAPTSVSLRPRPQAVVRQLTEEERNLVVDSVKIEKAFGGKRRFEGLFSHMSKLLGESMKARNFNGFGSARAFLDQAERERLIKYGPEDVNGLPTVYLPDEHVPS